MKCNGPVDGIDDEEDPRREQIALKLQGSFDAMQDHYLKQSLPLKDDEDEERGESSGARHVRFSPLVIRYGEGGSAHRKP